MAFSEDQLGGVGALTRAIGLTRGEAGANNPDWFSDPVGGSAPPHTNANGFATILSDDDQRKALEDFVDDILGPPTGHDEGAVRWVPLFSNPDPAITVYAVLEPTGSATAGTVRVGVGLEHSTGSAGGAAPRVTTRVHVPIAHVPRGGTDIRPSDGANPAWLILGRPGGRIGVEVEATFTDDAPVPREAFLRGARVAVGIPTGPEDVTFSLTLTDLQLPGAATPTSQTLSLDDLASVGEDLLQFLVGLVRAQVAALDPDDAAFRHVIGLAGALGLRDGIDDLPPFPLPDLLERGLPAVVEWIEHVLTTDESLDAWLAQVALLTGGTADATRNAVGISVGPARILVGIGVAAGTGGHPVLTPWVELTLDTRAGAEARAHVDLLRADTATGSVTAVPGLRAEAVFGEDSGGQKLLTGGPGATGLGSVHLGIGLDEVRRPALVLTMHNVDLPGPHHHDVLDLSTPDAAVDALDSALDATLSSALDSLGQAGDLLKILLGVDPPGAVDGPHVVDLVRDPVATFRAYWHDVSNDADAMSEALAAVRALLVGIPGASVPGLGTEVEPWRVVLGPDDVPVALEVWRDASTLRVALGCDADLDVLDDLRVAVTARISLLAVDLATGVTTFLDSVRAEVGLRARDAGTVHWDLGDAVTLAFDTLGLTAGWSPTAGLGAAPRASGLAVLVTGPLGVDSLPLALPTRDATGAWVWNPDWDGVEEIVGHLLRRVDSALLEALADLLGWGTQVLPTGQLAPRGARLGLAALVADPAAALTDWALGLALDCRHLGQALRPVAWLLSAGSLSAPLGQGRPDHPWRTPVGGSPRAPGLAVWTVPGCPVTLATNQSLSGAFAPLTGSASPAAASLAGVLDAVGSALPDIADLLHARPHLGDGLSALVTRWAGTDGLIAVPATVADGAARVLSVDPGVTVHTLPGYTYAALVASARTASFALPLVPGQDGTPSAVVHVGCDDGTTTGWLDLVPSAQRVDASGVTPARLPAHGDGPWFVKLPTVAQAAADRPDHDGLLAQAERLAAALADRVDPVLLVGHGGAGAATVRSTALAGVGSLVDDVVTVGTPWSPVATTALETGLGGDALRLLATLLPDETPRLDDPVLALGGSPHRRGVDLVRRARAEVALLPGAAGVTRDAGVRVHAVFGSLSAGDVADALAGLLAGALTARAEGREALPSGPPQEVHVGADLPVLDLELGGLLIGAGARVDLLAVDRTTPHLRPLREIVVELQLAVTDGWLVGGPGASQHDLECRWLGARIHVPLDGGAGTTELTLHEARAHAAYRESWTVTDDADGAPPEVRILLGEVVARMAARPELARLLGALGLLRSGGLDPDGLDRLLHDPAATLRPAVAAAPATVAGALRDLLGPTPGPTLAETAFRLVAGPASLTVDLADGSLVGGAVLTDPLPLALSVTAGAAGASVEVSLGAIDATGGGLRLVGSAATGGVSLRIDQAAPGAAVRPVALLPGGDPDALLPLLTTFVPALLLQVLGTTLRGQVEDPVLDDCLAAVGLLGPPDEGGARSIVFPQALITDPGGWLRTRVDPLAAAVALLDAVARVVAPTRGATPGWPLTDDVTLTYAVVGGRLELAAVVHLTTAVDGRPVVADVTGGLSVGTTGAPTVLVDARVTVDGWGLDLGVGGLAGPPVHLDLVRPAPQSAIRLAPGGAGLGDALASGAGALVVVALNELLPHRNDAASLTQQVATVAYEVCGALDLLVADRVDSARLTAYAQPPGPGAVLLTRLPALATTGLAALAAALDPAHTLVASTLTGAVRRFDLGPLAGGVRPFHVSVDGSTTPAVIFGCDVALGTVGRLAVDELRIDASGLGVSLRGGPFAFDLGGVVLRPLVVVRAGVTSGGFTRLVGIGLAVDDHALESVQVRWNLDAQPPGLWAITGGTSPHESEDLLAVAADLLGIAVGVASSLLVQHLGDVVSDRATAILQDVLFTGGDRTIDPAFIHALFHPQELLTRLEVLAWNCATASPGLGVTIDHTVTISLEAEDTDTPGAKRIGLRLDLAPGTSLVLSGGDPKVELVAHADWITGAPPEGLTIYILEGTRTALEIVPAVTVAGVGLRFSGASTPIIDLDGFSIDAIEVNLYGEASREGLGGGIRLKLDGLAVAPAGAGGTNGMANSIMSDVGSATGSSRPSFGPSLALQVPPGGSFGLTLRAGDPPGPWWLVIQRQLGPLYVERVGLGTTESDGTVTSISLLFTGQLSLFGLTAAVDGLGITWLGGDVADLHHWSVDLTGLAVSADMAGVSLSGGLLKFKENDATSYVGMLVGRFAAYGLSVFGGFTDDHGNASFFIFGGVNGPFGGPPMFFLTGIGGGLGINRGLRVPKDISRFGEYPFIQALDPAATPPENPMDQLKSLSAYFPHQMGNFWFAAGISFTCFNLVDGIAVVAVSFGNGLDVNLFGLARMALPRPGAAIVSIELGLLAHFSTSEGVFLIQAQLTDNSWLLYEDVRLTGGFAFAIWWKGPLAGQFVLTMGGYHPDFPVPAGYPEVPRLGLVWQVSDAIVIKGGSYFALTSEALMAGTDVEVSLDFGWVWAKVAFGAHGIVWFDPFWFEVMAYARISAGIDIDLPWPFGSLSFSITIGAQVKVWGPDFAGRAEFEIGPCTVPVEFGSKRRVEPATLEWGPFVTKYLEDAGGQARALSAITGKGSLPTATNSPQGAPSADGSASLPFQVFAEFELTITTTIPTTHVDVALDESVPVPLTLSNGAATNLGLAPMGAGGLTSVLRVTLEHRGLDGQWQQDTFHLRTLATNLTRSAPHPDGTRITRDHYPLGVWGQPKALGAAPALPSTDVVAAGNRVTLVAEISAQAVGPQIDYYRVEAARRPLPLRATGATRTAFLKTSRDLDLPTPATAEEALTLAQATMFPAVADVMTSGQHSALARAAYRHDRVAPPRIGSLTDGLARVNGSDGDRTVLPTVERTAPTPRRPIVAGLLTSGVGAARRPDVTTVADGRLKRRPAPTLESVKGRLGAHLPVALARSATPGVVRDGTLLVAGALPRTDVAGAIHSYAGGRVGAPALTAGLPLVAGLGGLGGTTAPPSRRGSRAARADTTPHRMRSGDLVLLQHPDAQIDVDPERRPTVAVDGSARIVTVAGRTVTGDRVVTDAQVSVPASTSLLAAHADGADAGGETGAAGWTARSRVARLSAHVALAAGCTLSVDVAGTGFQDAGTGWTPADTVVGAAREVLTRFAAPVTTVAVALTGEAPRSLTPADLDLVGASPVLRADGSAVPPVVVLLGTTTVLVQAVVPDRQRLAEDGTGITVVIRSGGTWNVAGVLGTVDDPTTFARRLARDGLDAMAGRVLATAGDGAGLTWTDAPKARARRAGARGRSTGTATRRGGR